MGRAISAGINLSVVVLAAVAMNSYIMNGHDGAVIYILAGIILLFCILIFMHIYKMIKEEV